MKNDIMRPVHPVNDLYCELFILTTAPSSPGLSCRSVGGKDKSCRKLQIHPIVQYDPMYP